MKLYQIIDINEVQEEFVLWELCTPYKKSIKTYYDSMFETTVVMVTSITNTTIYVKFVGQNELIDAIYAYLGVDYIETDGNEIDFDADLFSEYENMMFNSFLL